MLRESLNICIRTNIQDDAIYSDRERRFWAAHRIEFLYFFPDEDEKSEKTQSSREGMVGVNGCLKFLAGVWIVALRNPISSALHPN